MKKVICSLVVLALLPIVYLTGCGSKNSPSGPPAPTSPTMTRTVTATPTVTLTRTVTATRTITLTPTITATRTVTPTATQTATVTLTPTPQNVQATVNLNSAGNYVILAHTGITNSGATTTCGGYASDSPSVDGGILENCLGLVDIADSFSSAAEIDLLTAYNDAMSRSGASLSDGADIGNLTLYPGVYTDGGDLNIQSGDLTLDALGVPNAVFIFQVSGVLDVSANRKIVLSGSAQAKNVFWAVIQGTLETSSHMAGNILATTSVTLGTGAKLTGRALANTGNVTLLGNEIDKP